MCLICFVPDMRKQIGVSGQHQYRKTEKQWPPADKMWPEDIEVDHRDTLKTVGHCPDYTGACPLNLHFQRAHVFNRGVMESGYQNSAFGHRRNNLRI